MGDGRDFDFHQLFRGAADKRKGPSSVPGRRSVFCPRCGEHVHGKQGTYGRLYECCGLRGWNGKPLEQPATLAARRRAHDVFDCLWTRGHMSRSAAYRWLSEALGVEEVDAHMSVMDRNTAERVADLSSAKLRELGDSPPKLPSRRGVDPAKTLGSLE